VGVEQAVLPLVTMLAQLAEGIPLPLVAFLHERLALHLLHLDKAHKHMVIRQLQLDLVERPQ
jgi:hypothetical protein